MADEPKAHHPLNDLVFVVMGLVFLLILWYANGGPQRADLRGLFLKPPPPVGPGGAYGPTFGNPGTSTPEVPAAQPVQYGYHPQ